ncbi:hypothetical protein COI93_24120 [Bacillus cereus]|uniref:Uncharacterized protein n=1 Tax=Bacillus cereus TaxID=1396 RepID=A0A2B0LIL5_BACCE|nr:hypothetical protein COI93_24120 [Bacillus cereus]
MTNTNEIKKAENAMKKVFKKVSYLVVGIGFAGSLVGCGTSSEKTSTPKKDTVKQEEPKQESQKQDEVKVENKEVDKQKEEVPPVEEPVAEVKEEPKREVKTQEEQAESNDRFKWGKLVHTHCDRIANAISIMEKHTEDTKSQDSNYEAWLNQHYQYLNKIQSEVNSGKNIGVEVPEEYKELDKYYHEALNKISKGVEIAKQAPTSQRTEDFVESARLIHEGLEFVTSKF